MKHKIIILFAKKMNVSQLRKLFIGIFNYIPVGAQKELIESILSVYFPAKHIHGNPKKKAA